MKTPAGDALLLIALFLWMTISVGPWWVGAGIFAAAWMLNLSVAVARTRRTR